LPCCCCCCSIDAESNRLWLSLLEEDTGVPESVARKFQKHLRNVDASVTTDKASSLATDDASALVASKKSIKRKASGDSAEDNDKLARLKRAKVKQVDSAASKKVKVKEVSLW